MRRGVRTVAAIAALTGWAGLALQLALFVGRDGAALGLWRYLGFFTTLSNIGVAIVASAVALGRGGERGLAGPRARLMGLTAILTVALVYSVLLRALWSPTGLDRLAGIILHDATPILFAMLWALMPHGSLGRSDLGWALAPPALYLGYALARGRLDGWYPYYFLDPAGQGVAGLALWLAGVMATFAIVAAGLIAIDRRLAR